MDQMEFNDILTAGLRQNGITDIDGIVKTAGINDMRGTNGANGASGEKNAAVGTNGANDAVAASYKPQKCEQLFSFLQLLLSENQKYNLTAIKQPSDAVYKHIIDSIWLASRLPQHAKLIDVGCGAGFPSLPLAIIRPDLRVTCLDSTAKKINFIEICIKTLGLDNVTTVCGRAEELAHGSLRDSFDIATARAVANLPVLCELCLPFVKPNGKFLAMKGRFSPEEFEISPQALKKLSAERLECHEYSLVTPDSTDGRTLVDITKVGKTNDNFPRKYSAILKDPLK